MNHPDGFIRPARSSDLPTIAAWLPKEGNETLAMNWKASLREFEKGRMLVWEDGATGLPVAYCRGSLNSTDSVLEVRPDCRRGGIGSAIAGYLIGMSAASGEPLLEIECPSQSSVAFWRKLGFTVTETCNGMYLTSTGRRALTLQRDKPEGTPIGVTVRFFPGIDAPDLPLRTALAQWRGMGVRTNATDIALPHHVACFDLDDGAELAVELMVGQRIVYCGPARGARAHGVEQCQNGYLIGIIKHQ